MLTELCAYCRNWFQNQKLYGVFKIADGEIKYADGSALPIVEGQYFRIIGSIFNDGVHRVIPETAAEDTAVSTLQDEEFDGSVWTMKVPKDFIKLAEEIEAWQAKNGSIDSQAMSPFTSESFGGYSYSKSAGSSADGSGGGTGWQSAFGNRLVRYRKI